MRRSLNPRSHGGPLMTDHLQLEDLDLELELLKRKREMIEEQQQQLIGGTQSFNRPRPFHYGNEPHQSYQGAQHFNSHLSRYNEPQQSSGYGGGGLLGKRPLNDQPWQSHSTPKRFSGPQGGSKRKFNSGPSPRTNQHKPEPLVQRQQQQGLMNKPFSQNPPWKQQPSKRPKSNFPSQRFNNPKTAKPVNKGFNPTKVTKPKSAVPANKNTSLPNAERAKLVQQATQAKSKIPENTDPNFILRNDQVPSQQLAGRLELALGNILKEIKTKYGNSEPHTVSFQSMFLQRQMKQAIRERLRGVMMGKYVGKADAIVQSYRQVFPVETDIEIVQIATNAQESAEAKKLAIKLEDAGTAYQYVKHNLYRLAEVSLTEIFEKVQKLYENEKIGTLEICNQILESDLIKEGKHKEEVKNESTAEVNDETVNEVKETGTGNADTEAVDNLQNEDMVKEDINQEENVTAQTEEAGKNDLNEEEDKPVDVENKNENEKPRDARDPAARRLDNLILSLLKRRLPFILPRYKNMLLKILNVSGSYQVTKDAILEKAQERIHIERRVAEAAKNITKNEPLGNENTAAQKPPILSPYMVKILGKPYLPKRKLMQDFLNGFKPTSVKKHRSMYLLFVSFDNKENFERLVAIKETTIGTCTVYIKASEKPIKKANESLNATATPNDSLDNNTTISSDLDEQINDLLSSIRHEEESKDENAQTEPECQNANGDVKTEAETNEKEVTDQVNGDNVEKKEDVAESKTESDEKGEEVNDDATENMSEVKVEELKSEARDKVEELKNEASGRATPTRASSRLANVTPSSIKTRRASKLANL